MSPAVVGAGLQAHGRAPGAAAGASTGRTALAGARCMPASVSSHRLRYLRLRLNRAQSREGASLGRSVPVGARCAPASVPPCLLHVGGGALLHILRSPFLLRRKSVLGCQRVDLHRLDRRAQVCGQQHEAENYARLSNHFSFFFVIHKIGKPAYNTIVGEPHLLSQHGVNIW